ncbi:MAG: hypothetical protein U5N85_11325 [Arcicella sp.]|nr:hypothetical protein [Arcicella sp.]
MLVGLVGLQRHGDVTGIEGCWPIERSPWRIALDGKDRHVGGAARLMSTSATLSSFVVKPVRIAWPVAGEHQLVHLLPQRRTHLMMFSAAPCAGHEQAWPLSHATMPIGSLTSWPSITPNSRVDQQVPVEPRRC